ncbi:hypothetical protein AVEN_34510-1 [Araneus ventricosus]|uniref:Uncharacterized protein n=1 Tax=Araneus ventricosus TaxID=182803 RepID=A0A4Y2QDS3_ARAVE|nr:hypothetical protein AVEN_34510-1 [Araneus ventricosus]
MVFTQAPFSAMDRRPSRARTLFIQTSQPQATPLALRGSRYLEALSSPVSIRNMQGFCEEKKNLTKYRSKIIQLVNFLTDKEVTSLESSLRYPATRSLLKTIIKNFNLRRWQEEWVNGLTGRNIQRILPKVSLIPTPWNREDIIFATGHSQGRGEAWFRGVLSPRFFHESAFRQLVGKM